MKKIKLFLLLFFLFVIPVFGSKKYIYSQKEYSDYVLNLLKNDFKDFKSIVLVLHEKNKNSYLVKLNFSIDGKNKKLTIDLLKPPYYLTKEMKAYSDFFLSKYNLVTVKTDYLLFMRNYFFNTPKPITYVWYLTLRGEDVFKYRVGNCFAISNYFIGLTRYVGLKSYYYYFPYTKRNYMSKNVLITASHIVCGVDIGMRDLAFVIDYFPDANIPYETLFRLRRIKKISDLEASGLFYSNLGVKSMMLKEYKKAEFLMLFAEKLFPTSANIKNNLAMLYKRIGNYNKSADYLLKALKYSKNKHYVIGNILRIKNHLSPSKEKEVMQKISNDLYDNYYWHLLKAKDFFKAKNYKMALKEAKKAEKLAPEDKEIIVFFLRLASATNNEKMFEKYLLKLKK